jgi:hypothetical protein
MAFLGGPRRRPSSYGPQPIRLHDPPPGPPQREKKDQDKKPSRRPSTGPLSAVNLSRDGAVIMGVALVVVVLVVVFAMVLRH